LSDEVFSDYGSSEKRAKATIEARIAFYRPMLFRFSRLFSLE